MTTTHGQTDLSVKPDNVKIKGLQANVTLPKVLTVCVCVCVCVCVFFVCVCERLYIYIYIQLSAWHGISSDWTGSCIVCVCALV